MRNFIIGILMLSSGAALANTYNCTLNTYNGVQYDVASGEIVLNDNIEIQNAKISEGDSNRVFNVDQNKKISVSFEDGDFAETTPAGIYKGMNLLTVRFFLKAKQVAFSTLAVKKGSDVIQTLAGDVKRKVNIFCQKL